MWKRTGNKPWRQTSRDSVTRGLAQRGRTRSCELGADLSVLPAVECGPPGSGTRRNMKLKVKALWQSGLQTKIGACLILPTFRSPDRHVKTRPLT